MITDHADTWEWDGASWTNVAISPNRPSTNRGVAFAFDSVRQALVSFGGSVTNQSWLWDGAAWTLHPSVSPPSARMSPWVFDPLVDKFVMFGGSVGGNPNVRNGGVGGGVGGTWVATRRAASTLTVDDPAVGVYRGTVEVIARLLSNLSEPLSGRTVRLLVNCIEHTGITDVDGVARATVDLGGLPAGVHTLTATFDGDASFEPATGTTTVTVNKAVPAVSWVAPASIGYGTPLSATQLNAQAEIPGTFMYTPPVGTILTGGTHELQVLFTPTDAANYESRSVSVSIEVRPVPALLVWNDPAPLEYGKPLGSAQLNASAIVPGTFTYLPTPGTVLSLGTHTLNVVFTPADQSNYTSSTASAQLTVVQATTSLDVFTGLVTPFSHVVLRVIANVRSGAGGGAVPPTGTVEFFDGATSLGVVPVGVVWDGSASILLTPTPGPHAYTAKYPGDARFRASEGATAPITLDAPRHGALRGWGSDSFGQLGDGNTNVNQSFAASARYADGTPVSDVVTMAVGQRHSVVVRADGSVWAWGDNSQGQIGDGTTIGRTRPVPVVHSSGAPFKDAVAVAVDDAHSVALKRDGTVWAWGYGALGQLGNGSTTSSPHPVQVIATDGAPLSGIVAVMVGRAVDIALRRDGTVWSWGDNNQGQLGDGTTTQRLRADRVLVAPGQPLTGVNTIWAGHLDAFAVRLDGTAWAWGSNFFGQLARSWLADGSAVRHAGEEW